MKTTGMAKKIDELGRLVIPKEIRNALDIDNGTVELYLDGDKLIVKKWSAHCVFCGGTDNLTQYKGKLVCSDCREEIGSAN